MPKTIVHNEVGFDGNELTPTIRFFLVPQANGDSLADRLFTDVVFYDLWNGNSHKVMLRAHVDDSIGTFSPGDSAALRALLLKLYNEAKDVNGY